MVTAIFSILFSEIVRIKVGQQSFVAALYRSYKAENIFRIALRLSFFSFFRFVAAVRGGTSVVGMAWLSKSYTA
jgi:hypothetical protein